MSDFLTGIAFFLIIEGLVYALAPSILRRMAEMLPQVPETQLRASGLFMNASPKFSQDSMLPELPNTLASPSSSMSTRNRGPRPMPRRVKPKRSKETPAVGSNEIRILTPIPG